MLEYSKDVWIGNGWASIEVDPVDDRYFMPILTYLKMTYDFPMPHITDGIDGYVTQFEIDSTTVMFSVDAWSFSIAFEDTPMRDTVLAGLLALPDDYFRL